MKRAKQRKPSAPRNPMVALLLFKKSGPHGKSGKALRREARIATQRKLSSDEVE